MFSRAFLDVMRSADVAIVEVLGLAGDYVVKYAKTEAKNVCRIHNERLV